MKKQLLQRTMLTIAVTLFTLSNFATDLIFDPTEIVPDKDGYFRAGIYKDKNEDGILELYKGCVDEYTDASHFESNTLDNGFYYQHAMVMPDCYPKNYYVAGDVNNVVPPDPELIQHAQGYVELTKSEYYDPDSVFGFITAPAVKGLTQIYIEASPDNSDNNGTRPIMFWVEFSTDGGITWDEENYIEDKTSSKLGDPFTYDTSNVDVKAEFTAMAEASNAGPIIIRIASKPTIPDIYTSQRVKIHYIRITCEEIVSAKAVFTDNTQIFVLDNTISTSTNEPLYVYNMLGQMIGNGKSVQVGKGIYIVRTKSGQTQRVLVE